MRVFYSLVLNSTIMRNLTNCSCRLSCMDAAGSVRRLWPCSSTGRPHSMPGVVLSANGVAAITWRNMSHSKFQTCIPKPREISHSPIYRLTVFMFLLELLSWNWTPGCWVITNEPSQTPIDMWNRLLYMDTDLLSARINAKSNERPPSFIQGQVSDLCMFRGRLLSSTHTCKIS